MHCFLSLLAAVWLRPSPTTMGKQQFAAPTPQSWEGYKAAPARVCSQPPLPSSGARGVTFCSQPLVALQVLWEFLTEKDAEGSIGLKVPVTCLIGSGCLVPSPGVAESPTPHYNNSILCDTGLESSLLFLAGAGADFPGMRDGVTLLKVWLHQRELDKVASSGDGLACSALPLQPSCVCGAWPLLFPHEEWGRDGGTLSPARSAFGVCVWEAHQLGMLPADLQ